MDVIDPYKSFFEEPTKERPKECRTASFRSVKTFATGIASPWFAAWEPIESLLDATNEQDELTRKWYEAKLAELSFTGLTSALLASLISGAMQWPTTHNTTWAVRACWYSGLMFIVASIASATQQSIMLHRFNSHPFHLLRLRAMLGYYDTNGTRRPRLVQVFVWQISVMMLRFGIYLFLAGLFVLLWHEACGAGVWRADDGKVAVLVTVVAVFALFCHGLSVYFGYSGDLK